MALSGEIAPLSCQEADALTHPLRLSWEKSSDKPPKFIPEPDSKHCSSESERERQRQERRELKKINTFHSTEQNKLKVMMKVDETLNFQS